ncbi:MAG TPA: thiamine pyrophosphate-dependent enzyme [Steroidobacter sp.]|uniref:alpha-ketoacid dehydrogenase subunit alpha/beta n=1 Tax=Steroidobacter sp. TaxID=1978227 RepID=UPI002EDA0DC7
MTIHTPGSKTSRSLTREEGARALQFYRSMYSIRAFEQRVRDLTARQPPVISGSVHLCAGQEAVPVGAIAALNPQDSTVATYRGHGWALATGISAESLLAEICHKSSGLNGGRAGSAMLMAPWQGFIGENSIVGAGVPIGCGTALADQIRGTGAVTVVSFGDGAMSQGSLHEGFVFASYRRLPVIFICENNGWSEFTLTSSILRIERLAERAAAYGMPSITVDGSDPFAVRDATMDAVARARAGGGPTLIECTVPRLWGHYNRDIEHYRPHSDKARAAAADPLVVLEQMLTVSSALLATQLAEIRSDVDRELEEVEQRVLDAADPHAHTATHHVFAPCTTARNAAPAAAETKEVRYVQAVNEALRRELEQRPDVLVYGEDVGKAGGVFGATRDLQRVFGPERVFDTPIAESAILGSAVGAAIKGLRPIVEIMWGDFLLVALDQLINQAANVRYVSEGRAHASLVVRTQQGVTPGSCAQHSQSLEALLFHIPGLRIGMPATPQDAYDMLRAAVADPDPVIIFESRALYQMSGPVQFHDTPEPIGGARVRHDGSDLAIITWGTCVDLAAQAARRAKESGTSVRVLDLRWLSPLDVDAIDETVERCGGRVLILHEANVCGGVGAEIMAGICERQPGAIVQRLGCPNIRMPASPILQAALTPGVETILKAITDLCASSVR